VKKTVQTGKALAPDTKQEQFKEIVDVKKIAPDENANSFITGDS